MKLIRKFNRFTCDTQLKIICFDIRTRQPSKKIRFSLKFKVIAGVWVYECVGVDQTDDMYCVFSTEYIPLIIIGHGKFEQSGSSWM